MELSQEFRDRFTVSVCAREVTFVTTKNGGGHIMISYVICMYVPSRLVWYVTTDLVEYQTLSYIFTKETPTATMGLMQFQVFASRAVGQILMWNRLLQDLQDVSQCVHFLSMNKEHTFVEVSAYSTPSSGSYVLHTLSVYNTLYL